VSGEPATSTPGPSAPSSREPGLGEGEPPEHEPSGSLRSERSGSHQDGKNRLVRSSHNKTRHFRSTLSLDDQATSQRGGRADEVVGIWLDADGSIRSTPPFW
jgi:hypothetical protein